MSNTDIAQEIVDSLSEDYADEVDVADVEAELDSYESLGVTGNEAKRGVMTKLSTDLSVPRDELFESEQGGSGNQSSEKVDINDIEEEDQWVTIEGEVVDLWDNDHDAIAQVGLIRDNTGTIMFTAFTKSELPLLVEGEQYRLENVVTDEYNGDYNIKLVSTTDVDFLEEEIDISNEVELGGILVAMQSGSGLIERDVDSGRYVSDPEDGQDTEFDLRIKAVLDDGHKTYNVIMNREITEALTGIRLDDAREMAMQALEKSVVAAEMRPHVMGRYFSVKGRRIGDYIIADDVEQDSTAPDVNGLLVKTRSM